MLELTTLSSSFVFFPPWDYRVIQTLIWEPTATYVRTLLVILVCFSNILLSWLKSNQWIVARIRKDLWCLFKGLSKILQKDKRSFFFIVLSLSVPHLKDGFFWVMYLAGKKHNLAFFSTIFFHDKVCAKDRLPSMEWNVIAPSFMAHVAHGWV